MWVWTGTPPWTIISFPASANRCSFNCPFNVLNCFIMFVTEFQFSSCVSSALAKQRPDFQSKATNSGSNCSGPWLCFGAFLSDNPNSRGSIIDNGKASIDLRWPAGTKALAGLNKTKKTHWARIPHFCWQKFTQLLGSSTLHTSTKRHFSVSC